MLLPLALAFITAVVLIVVLGPLVKGARAAPDRIEFDRAVYRDQLKELERDRTRGLIVDSEAQTARLEIERRLLVADRADVAPPRQARPVPLLAAVVALVVAGGAGALYLALGAPGVPDLPFAARSDERQAASEASTLEKSAADLETRLAIKPDDTEGWLALARADAGLQRWQQSADAYRRALALAPGRGDIAAGLGETLVLAADGIVTPAAHDVFAAILAKDPSNSFARYYLALGDAQAGRTGAAIDAWQKLAAEAPDGAPIRGELQRRIAEAAQSAGIAAPPLAPPAAAATAGSTPGPDAAQMAAAASLPPEQRETMIRGMVEKLATQLQSAPDDLDGWLRLARAYGVLGERDKAADAFEHAARLDPKNAQIPLGEVDALLSDQALEAPLSERVVTLLHRAETLSPEEPEVLWYLGLAAAQAHKPDEATGYWQRLLTALPADAPERKTVTAALAAIKGK